MSCVSQFQFKNVSRSTMLRMNYDLPSTFISKIDKLIHCDYIAGDLSIDVFWMVV